MKPKRVKLTKSLINHTEIELHTKYYILLRKTTTIAPIYFVKEITPDHYNPTTHTLSQTTTTPTSSHTTNIHLSPSIFITTQDLSEHNNTFIRISTLP